MPLTDKQYAHYKEWAAKRIEERALAAKELLGGVCFFCGSTEKLQFHHPPDVIKLFNISQGWGYSDDKFFAEVLKCDLLCFTCHNQMREGNKGLVHGTYTGYTYYACRCEPCRNSQRLYRARRKQEKGK